MNHDFAKQKYYLYLPHMKPKNFFVKMIQHQINSIYLDLCRFRS